MDDRINRDSAPKRKKQSSPSNRAPVSRIKLPLLDTDCPMPGLSPYQLLLVMVVSIFITETFVRYFLTQLTVLPMEIEAIVDASLLLIILSPTLYLFHYQPLSFYLREQEKMLDQLSNNEERLNLALNAVNDGLWDWDMSNGNTYFSPRCWSMLGCNPEKIKTNFVNWKKLLHPDDKQKLEAALKRHLDELDESFECEFRMKSKTQRWHWFLARGRIVTKNEKGNPLRMIGTQSDIHLRKISQEKLLQKEKNIRYLSRELILNSETEKNNLARDLHDEFGQLLLALQIDIDAIKNQQSINKIELDNHCSRSLSIIDKMSNNIHHICDNLSPVMLEDVGLGGTLKRLIKDIEQHVDSIKFRVSIGDAGKRLPKKIGIVFYRICQEALNNAIKHAEASTITIELSTQPEYIILKIKDDGIGFNKSHMTHNFNPGWGIGMLGMYERAAAINAKVGIDSYPGDGTAVELKYPLIY